VEAIPVDPFDAQRPEDDATTLEGYRREVIDRLTTIYRLLAVLFVNHPALEGQPALAGAIERARREVDSARLLACRSFGVEEVIDPRARARAPGRLRRGEFPDENSSTDECPNRD
jgi:hypothetical protein